MHSSAFNGLVIAAAISLAPPAAANVITDWDAKAVVAVTPMASLGGTSPYMAQRMMAMVHAAMFDAVNSIERRYRPYLIQLPAESTTSKEAAAASAAAAVLAIIDEKTAGEMKTALANYLAAFPDGAAKSDGIKLGGSIAASIIAARIHDGSDGPDAYRPRTSPGIYIPTTITISSMWPDMTPFAIAGIVKVGFSKYCALFPPDNAEAYETYHGFLKEPAASVLMGKCRLRGSDGGKEPGWEVSEVLRVEIPRQTD